MPELFVILSIDNGFEQKWLLHMIFCMQGVAHEMWDKVQEDSDDAFTLVPSSGVRT